MLYLASAFKNWREYSNEWLPMVAGFYEKRGLSRPQVIETVPYIIGQSIASQKAVREGLARESL